MSVDFAPMNATYVRSSAIAEAPLTAACPRCEAPRGEYCRASSGYGSPFHSGRKNAIRHLTDDERYDAVMRLREEIAARRAEAFAAIDPTSRLTSRS